MALVCDNVHISVVNSYYRLYVFMIVLSGQLSAPVYSVIYLQELVPRGNIATVHQGAIQQTEFNSAHLDRLNMFGSCIRIEGRLLLSVLFVLYKYSHIVD